MSRSVRVSVLPDEADRGKQFSRQVRVRMAKVGAGGCPSGGGATLDSVSDLKRLKLSDASITKDTGV